MCFTRGLQQTILSTPFHTVWASSCLDMMPCRAKTTPNLDQKNESRLGLRFSVIRGWKSKKARESKAFHIEEPKLRTPLMTALKSGNLYKIRQLLSSGADLNSPGPTTSLSRLQAQVSSYPLIWAVDVGKPEAVRLLLDNGADPNICCEYTIGSRACWLRPLCHSHHPAIVTMLLDAGAEVNALQRSGSNTQTALFRSAFFNPSIAELLIERGADVNIADEKGSTALVRAMVHSHNGLAERLIQAGADVNLFTSSKITPLMVALDIDSPHSLVRSLLQSGADPHLIDEDGNTALHFAIKNQNVQAIEWLVAENVNPETSSKNSMPALEYLLHDCNIALTATRTRGVTDILTSLWIIQMLAVTGTNHVGNSFVVKQTQAQLVVSLNSFLPESLNLSNDPGSLKKGGYLREIHDIVHALVDMFSNPLSLKHLCRVQIRRSLGREFRRKLHQLNVPLPLQAYLMIYEPIPISEQFQSPDDDPTPKTTYINDPATAAVGDGS